MQQVAGMCLCRWLKQWQRGALYVTSCTPSCFLACCLAITAHRTLCCRRRLVQELELHNRYVAALDALTNPHPTAARKALDQAAAASGELGVSMDGYEQSTSKVDAFDARLRRTLAEHVSRAEAVEVSTGCPMLLCALQALQRCRLGHTVLHFAQVQLMLGTN